MGKVKKRSGKLKNGKSNRLSSLDIKILRELYDAPEGLRARSLIRNLLTPQRTIYNHLKLLESKGIIKNIYPMWKIHALSKKWQTLLSSDNIQCHNFKFVVKLIRKPHWWNKRGNKLMKLKEYMFKNINWGNTKCHQLERDDWIIQAFPNTIVIISRKKHWGGNAYDCMCDAVVDCLELIRFLEEFYKIKLTMEGIPHMNISSNHFVELKNALADRCKEDKRGFMVEVDGEKRVWVDFSIPFGFEYGSKDHALDDYKRLNPHYADMLQMDEVPLMSDIMQLLHNQQNQINMLVGEGLNGDTDLKDKPFYVG